MLFPQDFLDRSVEHLFSRSKVRSQFLYTFTLLFILLLFSSLPFIHIDIGKSARGIVAPISNKVSLYSTTSGIVSEVYIAENREVKQGELLVAFETQSIDIQIEKNKNDQLRAKKFIEDLEVIILATQNEIEPVGVQSFLYQSEWNSFKQERNELEQGKNNQQLIYDRLKVLYNKGIVSKVEYEKSKYELDNWEQRIEMLTQHQLKVWQTILNKVQIDFESFVANEAELLKQKNMHYVYVPVSGTLQNTIGISSGSVLTPNQLIAEISPDTSLIVELYVSPSDIGLIRAGMEVRLQVDAFNYNEWGFLNGTVLELPNDAIVTENGEVLFIIRCSIENTELSLPNGFRASLKKGMTLQGHFILARRSLFQLLYDNVDDWMNPTLAMLN